MKPTLSQIEKRVAGLEGVTESKRIEKQHDATREALLLAVMQLVADESLTNEEVAAQVEAIGGNGLLPRIVRIRQILDTARQRKQLHETNSQQH